ncbi:hypothetical protein GCM10023229_08680 [Flavisolibacter ginsenosidimutans]
MNPLSRMKAFSLLLLASLFFVSCKKETETLQPEVPKDYLPTQPGKYITYRTDSTVYTNFGSGIAVHSYQEKTIVDSLITDNLGRPSYRVFRFLRDTAGKTAWQPAGTYFITPTANAVEVIENNLRFLKLAAPVSEGTSWKANRFLPDDPYGAFYDFSNDDGMADWDYGYTNVDQAVSVSGKQYDSTVTVQLMLDDPETNTSANFQIANAQLYGFKNYSTEKYAKGLGLIYQEYIMWEYQPPSSPRPGYRGFGVKRSIIDHN